MQKMHADELDIDAGLVRRLLADQFPEWAGLPLERVPSSGTDNALFRLGAERCVRLPRTPQKTGQVDKDFQWMPRLAPHLPVAIPEPLARGTPAAGFPLEWGVYRWLEGESSIPEGIEPEQLAVDLAAFVKALQGIDPAGGPPAGPPNTSRGVPVRTRDAEVRKAIAALHGEIDADAVRAAWEAVLRAPDWDQSPVWVHGDLAPGNLLVAGGRLSAVVDFASACVGDPANDVMAAWTLFSADGRERFRRTLDVDDATWIRGRGWALSWALIALPYYLETNPGIVGYARHTLAEVLSDARSDALREAR